MNQEIPEKVLIDLPTVCKNLILRIRIRYLNNDIYSVTKQKYNKKQAKSKLVIGSNSSGTYLLGSPSIDFPFIIRGDNGEQIPIYLQPIHLYGLNDKLKFYLDNFKTKDLYFYNNGILYCNKDIASKFLDKILLHGIVFTIGYCVVQDFSNSETNPISYEGIYMIEEKSGVYIQMTIDELKTLIKIIDSIDMAELCLNATKIGIDLLAHNLDYIEKF